MRLLTLTMLSSFAVGPAAGQRLAQPFHSAAIVRVAPPPSAQTGEPPLHQPLLAAAGLGLLGWGVGAVAGGLAEAQCDDELCLFEGIVYGGAAGGGLGLAIGAHLGNRRRGSFPLDLLVSGVVWGAGFGTMSALANHRSQTGMAVVALLLPPTQLLATVFAERATGH